MFANIESSPWIRRILISGGTALLCGLALALRLALYHIETSDYTVFLSSWYDYIQTHGGLAALKDSFSNYNTPYLTLLALATYLPIPKLIAIKTLSVLFDGVMALFVYLLLRTKYTRGLAAGAGALVVLFAPTIVINSAAWGQCDAIYVSFCLGSLFFLLKRRPGWACTFFALALSFKLQAVFFAPVLFVLLLKRALPLRYLALIPLVFALMLTPALIAGRSPQSLLSIYAQQASSGGMGGPGTLAGGGNTQLSGGPGGTGQGMTGGPGSFNGGGAGQNPNNGPGQQGQAGNAAHGQFNGNGQNGPGATSTLTQNAPSFYQWLPSDAPADYWKWAGIVLAGLFVLIVGLLTLLKKQLLTPALLLKIALLFALAIPFLLPEMHERYFYLADVVSILYVFFFPRASYVAILTQLCSLLSYTPYLLNTQIVPLAYVAGVELLLILMVGLDLLRTLFNRERNTPVARQSQGDPQSQHGDSDQAHQRSLHTVEIGQVAEEGRGNTAHADGKTERDAGSDANIDGQILLTHDDHHAGGREESYADG